MQSASNGHPAAYQAARNEPMRIAYLVERDVSREDAVVKKAAFQIRAWQAMGHSGKLFALSAGTGIALTLRGIDATVVPWRRWRDWWSGYSQLVEQAIDWQPDLVYFRFSSYFPALGRLMRRVPTVVEINTDDVAEYRLTMTRKAFAYHRATRGRLFRLAKGLVAVTEELANLHRQARTPLVVVSNGIDLESIELFEAPNNVAPRLFFLGQRCMPWHGVDKIACMAQMNPDWHFDVVGDESFGLSSVPANMCLHGFLETQQYRSLLERADVALGPLAIHRKAMSESCALKVREYLASGLPTVIGGDDSDFLEETPFLLKLGNTEDNIEREQDRIRKFVQQARGMRVPRTAIRHLDLAEKERLRAEFFAQVLQGVRATDAEVGT